MNRPTYRLAMVANDRRAQVAFVLLLVGAVCISLAPIFVRLSPVGPVPSALWRTVLAVPFLAAMIPLLPEEAGRARLPNRWTQVAGFMLVGLLFAAELTAFHLAIELTSVANATLLPNTAPIFVALYSFVLFGTRFSRRFLGGMVLAVIGVILLMAQSIDIGRQHLIGDLFGVLAAMLYAGYFLAVARLRAEFSTPVVMTLTIAFTAVFLIPITAVAGGPWLPDRLYGWMILAALAVVSQALGQGLIAFAFAYLPPAFGAVTLLVQPVLAAVFAWVLFGEALGVAETAGIAVVLAGVLIARQGSLRKSRT